MKYLKYFEGAYGDKYISILDDEIENYIPKKMSIYTQGAGGDGGGSYELKYDSFTREIDIIRILYYQNTFEVNGDATSDGEPNILEFDLHFFRKENTQKIIVDISYGDNIVSSFSIEQPSKINVQHYNGVGSNIDSDTHFGLNDDSIEEWVNFFNRFGFRLDKKDFVFIDKYPETYIPESIKLTPLTFGKKLLIVNNSKPHENRFLKNILRWCQNRGIDYVTAISDRDVERVCQYENIVGVILTGSDYRVSNPLSDSEGEGSEKALQVLGCPILAIGYGFQIMSIFYGSKIKEVDFVLDNKILTQYKEHVLFKEIDMKNTQFAFSYHDIIESCPEGFEVIATLDDNIVGISNKNQNRYGVLFHPEDSQRTYQVLDNFISLFDNVQDEQDLIKLGKFEHLETFKTFKINENVKKVRDF